MNQWLRIEAFTGLEPVKCEYIMLMLCNVDGFR